MPVSKHIPTDREDCELHASRALRSTRFRDESSKPGSWRQTTTTLHQALGQQEAAGNRVLVGCRLAKEASPRRPWREAMIAGVRPSGAHTRSGRRLPMSRGLAMRVEATAANQVSRGKAKANDFAIPASGPAC
jgi:hypothetical protein